jgi:hypothetical protein
MDSASNFVYCDYKTRDQAYLRLQLENGTFMECSMNHVKILTEQGKFALQTFIGYVNKEMDTNAQFEKDAWLLDSGASVHIVKKKSYCSRTKEAQERVTIGDNGRMEYSKEGQVYLQDRKTGLRLKLDCAKIIPNFAYNIVSLGQLIK